jgi:glycosyltransferase involved in cell wall biosynthesis
MASSCNLEILISIVVPTYNRLFCVSDLINRFLAISDDRLELIVVDDGSTDQTYETLKEVNDPRLKVFRIKNSERGAARNFGASRATGRYVNYFDSDDIPHPHYLETVIGALQTGLYEWIVFGYGIKSEVGSVSRPKLPRKGRQFFNALSTGNPFPPNSVFIRRDIALLYPFNESRDLAGSEDYELWLRLCLKYEPLYLPNISPYLLRQWTGRSVNNILPQKATRQCNSLLKAINNLDWHNYAVKFKNLVIAGVEMYFSLLLISSPEYRIKSLALMIHSLFLAPGLFFTRRPYAIVKLGLKSLVYK